MKLEPLKLIHGSGNVYRDLGFDNADVLQLKGLLAAQIVKLLDREKLSMRQAHAHRHRGGGLFAHLQFRSFALYG